MLWRVDFGSTLDELVQKNVSGRSLKLRHVLHARAMLAASVDVRLSPSHVHHTRRESDFVDVTTPPPVASANLRLHDPPRALRCPQNPAASSLQAPFPCRFAPSSTHRRRHGSRFSSSIRIRFAYRPKSKSFDAPLFSTGSRSVSPPIHLLDANVSLRSPRRPCRHGKGVLGPCFVM